MKKYIWDQLIKTINEDNTVLFEDETTKYFSDKELSYLVTDEPKDLEQLRNLMLDAVIPKLLEVLEDYNIKKGYVQLLIQELVATYNNTFNIAVWKAFWTFEEWKHSAFFPEEIRISDIKKIKEL